MPQLKYAPSAIRDLQRLREFLRAHNLIAAKRSAETILKALQILGHQPHIGRPIEEMPDRYREWLINFGDSGYVARYRIDTEGVTILAIRHQKEAGYHNAPNSIAEREQRAFEIAARQQCLVIARRAKEANSD